MRRTFLAVLAAVLVLALAGSSYGAWYFSDQMVGVTHPPPRYPETVLKVTARPGGGTLISLKTGTAVTRPGRYGLSWPGGKAVIGPIVARTPERVDRLLLWGDRPADGTRAGMSWTYPGANPKEAVGLNYREVQVATELGPAPAWYIPAGGRVAPTWLIAVHGSNADRRQPLKFVPAVHRAGIDILDITYRNDVGAPKSADGVLHIGQTEWRDLEAAVRTALAMGARRVVLYGGSMGGAISLQFLTHSKWANRISGLILDAPELSVSATMNHAAAVRGIPAPITWLARVFSNWRAGFDITRIDALASPPKARPATLLLQGSLDDAHPTATARQFAAMGPRLGWRIQYAEFPGAGHSEAWNSDPDRCDKLITTFLASF